MFLSQSKRNFIFSNFLLTFLFLSIGCIALESKLFLTISIFALTFWEIECPRLLITTSLSDCSLSLVRVDFDEPLTTIEPWIVFTSKQVLCDRYNCKWYIACIVEHKLIILGQDVDTSRAKIWICRACEVEYVPAHSSQNCVTTVAVIEFVQVFGVSVVCLTIVPLLGFSCVLIPENHEFVSTSSTRD